MVCMLLLSACSKVDLPTPEVTESGTAGLAPLVKRSQKAVPIKGNYIVVFKDNVRDIETETSNIDRSIGIKHEHTYKHAVRGFSAAIPDAMLEALRKNPKIKYIEEDQVVEADGIQVNPATWGLDRIDQHGLPLDQQYAYTPSASGVDAYIFDTGILFSHQEFEGRAVSGYNSFNPGSPAVDDNGHGTHVAAILGGASYGVAKDVNLIAVKVMSANGSGTIANLLAGMDWAVGHHTNRPAVGNMSLGTGASNVIDDAVQRLIDDGIIMCVSAGNSAMDANNFSPARLDDAITVGATASDDSYGTYSNFGNSVDILAPGTSIRSAWIGSATSTRVLTGTSMASPHVAGVTALYLGSGIQTSDIEATLKSSASYGVVRNTPAGTANLLVYNVPDETPTLSLPSAPTVFSPASGTTKLSTTLDLSWSTVPNAVSYGIIVSTDTAFNNVVYSNYSLGSPNVTLPTLMDGIIYYWKVYSWNQSGRSHWSPRMYFITDDSNIELYGPGLLGPDDRQKDVFAGPTTFRWATVWGAYAYEIRISPRANFERGTIYQKGIASSTYKVNLRNGTRYYWQVRGVTATGRTGPWSASQSFITVN